MYVSPHASQEPICPWTLRHMLVAPCLITYLLRVDQIIFLGVKMRGWNKHASPKIIHEPQQEVNDKQIAWPSVTWFMTSISAIYCLGCNEKFVTHKTNCKVTHPEYNNSKNIELWEIIAWNFDQMNPHKSQNSSLTLVLVRVVANRVGRMPQFGDEDGKWEWLDDVLGWCPFQLVW